METENDNVIRLKIPRSTRISYTTLMTGEIASVKITEPHLSLVRGRLYKIPVNNTGNLDDHNVLRVVGKISEVLDVRNVENGIATILPIVQNTFIEDGMIIGTFL